MQMRRKLELWGLPAYRTNAVLLRRRGARLGIFLREGSGVVICCTSSSGGAV